MMFSGHYSLLLLLLLLVSRTILRYTERTTLHWYIPYHTLVSTMFHTMSHNYDQRVRVRGKRLNITTSKLKI